MNTNLYLSPQQSFEEHEKDVKERYKLHAREFELSTRNESHYFYPFAYGSLKAAYIHLYKDYEKLKAEYDKEKAAIESSHLNLAQ